jgi:hypothetical protein
VSRRPLATVRILKQPDLSPDAVRVEIECRSSTTGLTSIPSKAIRLTVPMMVTQATYAHEERCGACDTTEAHAQGDQRVRERTEQTWSQMQARLVKRYAESRRN